MKYPVLLLDDNHNWLTVYCHGLMQKQYIIDPTASLADAIEKVHRLPYPVIISDLRIAGTGKTGGIRLLDEAKKNNKYTKVIIITAYGGVGTAVSQKVIKNGAFAYLIKPVDLSKLDECITTAIHIWEREIEESIHFGFLNIDYISQLFSTPGKMVDILPDNAMSPDTATVLIDYTHCDVEKVDMIANVLQKNGIQLWYDKEQTGQGDLIFTRIKEKIQNNMIILIILSKEAINSGWITEKANEILDNYEKNKKITIIPVIIDDVEVPSWLVKKKRLDLRINAGKKITELIHMIKSNIDT